VQQPYFQYSQCNGKKKALCVSSTSPIRTPFMPVAHQIGINYFGQASELRGCINDARNIQRFLCCMSLFSSPETSNHFSV
jgi:hypothetical protein